jgi:Phasin protein
MAPSKAVRPEKENVVVKNFEEMQKVGQENANAAMKSFGVVSKGVLAIATEVADYSKKFFEEGTQAFEQLLGKPALASSAKPICTTSVPASPNGSFADGRGF